MYYREHIRIPKQYRVLLERLRELRGARGGKNKKNRIAGMMVWGGYRAVGEDAAFARFTKEQILDIRHQCRSTKKTYRQIGIPYGLGYKYVWKIAHRVNWAWLNTSDRVRIRKVKQILTVDKVLEVRRRYPGEGYKRIGKALGISWSAVRNIIKRRSWAWLEEECKSETE